MLELKGFDESEEGNLLLSMFSKKMKKNIEEENKEAYDNIKKDKVIGDLEKMLKQSIIGNKKF